MNVGTLDDYFKFNANSVNWDNKDEVMAILKKKCLGWVLIHASDRLKDDKDVVMLAMSKFPWGLQDASKRLRDDDEVVYSAINKKPKALMFASERIRESIKNEKNVQACSRV